MDEPQEITKEEWDHLTSEGKNWKAHETHARHTKKVLESITRLVEQQTRQAHRINELVEFTNLLEARVAMLELDVKIGDEREF